MLEALQPEGDADHRAAEQQPVHRCAQRKGNAAYHQPEDVHQQRGQPAAGDHLQPEGAEGKLFGSGGIICTRCWGWISFVKS